MTTGNEYDNERIAQDLVLSNQEAFTDSGMVEMMRMYTDDKTKPIEVTILYSIVPTSIMELKKDIIHREFLRRVALEKLWEVLDPGMVSLELSWYAKAQSSIHYLIIQVLVGEVALHNYRHQKLMRDPCQRFIQACIAVVDGLSEG